MTAKKVVIQISAIILVTEFLIMLVLGTFGASLNYYVAAIIDVTVLAAIASPAIYLWVIRSFVVARDDALAEVRALALYDPLTKLPNRRLLAHHLEKFIQGSPRHLVDGALLMIDLDGFKSVNDTNGHDAGDAVLIEVARRIQSIIRESDMAARVGGDEFVVLIERLNVDPAESTAQAVFLAERLIKAVGEPVVYFDRSLIVGASIGIRMLGRTLLNPQAILSSVASGVISDADKAMYEAKRRGKGRVMVFQAMI